MQTFVVKLSSGIAALVASITLGVLKLSNKATTAADQVVDFSQCVNTAQKMGLRLVMTLIPAAVLVIAFVWFRKRYKLNDKNVLELADQVAKLHEAEGKKED